MLVKEVRAAELRAWEVKFDNWMRCSLQGTAPGDFAVNTFLSVCDTWWINRLLPKKKDSTILGDLTLIVRDKMKVLFPISKRRDLLFECRQKNGQSASEYYLELKDLAQDYDLDKMGTESLFCHLLLSGLNNSEMKLHEKKPFLTQK